MNQFSDVVVLIPTYNNAQTLGKVIDDVLQYSSDIIVVNDGSTDSTPQVLSSYKNIEVVEIANNMGKGNAIITGLRVAANKGFKYAITIDSDGQHFASDIPVFLDAIGKSPNSLIIGERSFYSDNMPGKNKFANRFSNFWVWVETGRKINDTQCGFRLYPILALMKMKIYSNKYELELELLVRCIWKGINVVTVPVGVLYQTDEERVSHFRPFRDFSRISVVHTVLVTLAFMWFHPKRLIKSNIEKIRDNNFEKSKQSNRVVALSVSLGLFCGIIPVWGAQMLIAIVLAVFFKLNKLITVVASNISTPPVIPFIIYGSFYLGKVFINCPDIPPIEKLSLSFVFDFSVCYILGSILLASLCSIVGGILTYIFLILFRKK